MPHQNFKIVKITHKFLCSAIAKANIKFSDIKRIAALDYREEIIG